MGTLPKKVHRLEATLADRIVKVSGSMTFVYLHIVAFTLFFIFRPFEVDIFNIFLSLEAVFLATFIMVAQNREIEIAEERAAEEQQEEEQTQEELQESFEDIQDEFDEMQKDLSDIKKLIEKIESKRISEKTPPAS